MAMDKETIKLIQQLVGADADGIWGPKSRAAFDEYLGRQNEQPAPAPAPAPEPASEGQREYTMPVSKSMPAPAKAGYFDSILSGMSPTTTKIMNQGRANSYGDRIAELEAQLAEVRRRKAALNTEEDMGKYKFVYDADPSTYMNYKQGIRTAKQTDDIRKSNDLKTERDNLRNSWKESGTSLLVARYDLADAENAYNKAVSASDPDAISTAGLALSRARANYQAKLRENDDLRSKVYEALGVTATPQSEVKDEDIYSADKDQNYVGAEKLQRTRNDLNLLEKEVKTDNMAINKTDKAAKINEWTNRLASLENQMKDSTLSDKNRGDLETQIQGIREAIRNFGKPAGKGGQTTKVTQAEVDAMNFTDLKRKGYAWLKAVQNAGLTRVDAATGEDLLQKAINVTRNKK